ncbi:class I SAM-dependent methyltransferase [Streptomyces sp. NPDC000927]|uniref:class I SAM-dependent methyltransferase n=1 Tax=Streptomyces sp. NPDC000927 TaxID=3154371 RepID=UPI003323EBA9
MRLADIVDQWDTADVSYLHPTRSLGMDAYWESGWAQTAEVAVYAAPGERVLDFGCGDGRIAIPLAQLGYQVIAVDSSKRMLDRLTIEAEPLGQMIKMHRSSGSGLGKIVGRTGVDLVLARGILPHHSHEDAAVLVRNLAKVLKPGGYLLADWPVGEHRERQTWYGTTTWDEDARGRVAREAGLELVPSDISASVWVRS